MKYPLVLSLGLSLLTPFCQAANVRNAPLPTAAPLELLKPESSGTYQDAKGSSHAWSVSQAHLLQWEGTPFLPVGATFVPLSWAGNAPDDAWDKDKAALEILGKGGVKEILLSAGTRGLTHVSTVRVQRVLDYLDGQGFDYGLRIADAPQDPLIGYVVKPAVYRNPSPSTSGPTRFRHIPGLVGALYLLVAPREAEIEESGAAHVTDGGETAEVTLKNPVTDDVLLLYPQRIYLAGTPESRLPDLWQGYDEYRDRLLTFFSRVKLGRGFRFFLDPLTAKIGFGGEVDSVIPTTDGYRLDFEAWLEKKYNHNVDDLNRGWGIREKDLPDFATAARCLPLWSGNKGVPAVYDPLKKVPYAVLNTPRIGGHVWEDLQQFRIESVRGYVNSIADVLKKSVADVPVVYNWGGRSPLFTNSGTQGGSDGLCLPDAVTGAYAFAQAEETPKTTWLLAQADRASPGDWDALKAEGVRGFYAPAATLDEAKQLAAYGASVSFEAQDLTETPRVLLYPAGVPNVQASLRRLSNGVWWLPSYRAGELFQPGDAFSLGPLLRGYKLSDPDGRIPRFVVWSPHGAMTQASFPFPKEAHVVITDAAGIPLKVERKKGTWTVPIGADPIVISHVSNIPLPADAADAADKEANRLLALAKTQGIPTQLIQEQLFHARTSIPDVAENADLRYNALAHIIDELTRVLQPYVWIEAESTLSYTFDSLVSDSEASGGSYLALDTDRPPPTGGGAGDYHADYRFSVNGSGVYAVWAAATPIADSSPFTYALDDGGENVVQDVETEGGPYAGRFTWSHLGDVTLGRGPHTLKITVAGPRARDKRYMLSLDAFCLSRVPFHPSGTQQPAIELLPPPDDPPMKGKKRGKGSH